MRRSRAVFEMGAIRTRTLIWAILDPGSRCLGGAGVPDLMVVVVAAPCLEPFADSEVGDAERGDGVGPPPTQR